MSSGARASLLVTDTRGNRLDLPPDARANMLAGYPHFAEAGAVASRTDRCALPTNPLHAGAPMRGQGTPLPRMDANGNAAGGVRGPALEAPKATYTGWNPRAEGFAPGALCTNTGAVLPFAATRAEREGTRDPRPSLEERYASPAAYAAAVKAAERLQAERLLLNEDVAAIDAATAADTLARLSQ